MKAKDRRNWAELPSVLLALIMTMLGPYEILENVQKVCKSWRRASKDPTVWRKIDMQGDMNYNDLLCREAVYRSQGGLVEINVPNIVNNDLLEYIFDRSSNLRSLRIGTLFRTSRHDQVLTLSKLPLLEELEFFSLKSRIDLNAFGHAMPNLKSLKINCSWYTIIPFFFNDDDLDALAIAKSMPDLRKLQLLGNRITDVGLKAIFDSCPHLEHLDLRQCLNIKFSGDLENRCLERIKYLRRPKDSTEDYPYQLYFNLIDLDEFDF